MRLLSIVCFLFSFYGTTAQDLQVYQFDKKIDLGIGVANAGLVLIDYALYKNLKPLDREMILNLDRTDINSFDRSATQQNSESARKLSDVFEFGVFVLPAPFIFSKEMRKETKEIAVMYIETFTLNLFSTTLVKLVTTRNRPFVYNPEVGINKKMVKNARMSMYSGHTSHTAAMSIFTAKVFSDFYPDSQWKPVVWGTAIAIPTITGYLRYKAGKHYPTDVIAGAAMGGLIGFLIPQLHKVKSKMPTGLSLESQGNGMKLNYRF